MIYFASFNQEIDGQMQNLNVFLYEDESGISAKDIINMPGSYHELVSKSDFNLYLVEMNSAKLKSSSNDSNTYNTSLFAPIIIVDNEKTAKYPTTYICINDELVQLLSVSETVSNALLEKVGEDNRKILKESYNSLKVLESITSNSKVCLPEEALAFLSDEQRVSMISKRKDFSLKEENYEIFQTNYDKEFCLRLPSIEEISNGRNLDINTLLGVLSPYRKNEAIGPTYSTIYHTPYYSVDKKLNGFVPSCFEWINGYYKNDNLDIMPHERKMYNNLYKLFCDDVSKHIDSITTAIFMSTRVGTAIRKLYSEKDISEIHNIVEEINAYAAEDNLSLNISNSDTETIISSNFELNAINSIILGNIELSDEYLNSLVETYKNQQHLLVISNVNNMFTLKLNEEQKINLTDKYIDYGIMTYHMFNFLRKLCSQAYIINWGHSGVTLAIPKLVDRRQLDKADQSMADWLNYKINGIKFNVKENIFFDTSDLNNDDDYIFNITDSDDDDVEYIAFDHYISTQTANMLAFNEVTSEYFEAPTDDPETLKVERWRREDGENGLSIFLTDVFSTKRTPLALIECFIKLCRWGEYKPKTITIDGMKNVFDLYNGTSIMNDSIIDESSLIKKNGCTYSNIKPIYTTSKIMFADNPIVGFSIEKDYGQIKKTVIATWLDIAECINDIADLKTLINISFNIPACLSLEKLSKQKYTVYNNMANIECSVERKMQAEELNPLTGLISNITTTSTYSNFLRTKELLTNSDYSMNSIFLYIKALKEFYTKFADVLSGDVDTRKFIELVESFKSIYNNTGAPSAKTSLNTLDLFGSNENDRFTDCELNGKFIIIYDGNVDSSLKPMNFKDNIMKNVSSQLEERIVLLLMATEDKFVFCRKEDVTVNEILREGNNLSIKLWNKIEPVLNHLKAGKSCKINKKDAFLHTDLKGIL